MSRAVVLAAALAAALFPARAQADVLVLENGQRIEGDVTEAGDTYEVKTKYGSLTIQKSQVRSRIPPVAKVLADAESARAVAKTFLKEAEVAADAAGRQAKIDAARALLERARKACTEAGETAADAGKEQLRLAGETLDEDLRAARAMAPPDVATSLPPPVAPVKPVPPPAVRPADPPAAPSPTRRPEPPAADQKAAEQEIRDLYRGEFAKRTPEEQLAFSRKLFRTAQETADNPAAQYVLYREAAELAAQAGDAEQSMAAIDRMAAAFDIDALALKTALLVTAAKGAREPEAAGALAECSLALVDEAVAADQYDTAVALLSRAETAARQAKGTVLLATIATRRREVEALRTAWQPVKADAKSLEAKPDDPVASLSVGRFLCFQKGDWERGLPLLAKGSDATLKALAEQDLAAPAAPDAQVALGDGWWDAAAPKGGAAKSRLQERAAHWYAAALPKLDGLAKVKAEKRILECEKSAQPGGSAGPAVDLLAWIDPAEHSVPPKSRWTLKGKTLVSAGNLDDQRFTRLQIPCVPPAEYDLTVAVECRTPGGPFAIGLVAGGRQFVVALDAASVAAGLFGGKDSHALAARSPNDRLAWKGAPFVEGKPSTIVCSVRRTALRVTVNGQVAIDWRNPPWAEATTVEDWAVPNKTCLFFVARDAATYEVSRILLQGVGGSAPRKIIAPVRPATPPPTR